MNKCIFCDASNEAKSIEHIVPESLGNKDYVIEKGAVCDKCNSRFSKFESKVLTNSILAMERARHGNKTKKGKPGKGKIGNIKVEGDSNFQKQQISIDGKTLKDAVYDPISQTFQIKVPSFDKSEVATSRFLLMMGLESLYTSKPTIFQNEDFAILKDYMGPSTKVNKDWPFLQSSKIIAGFGNIPTNSPRRKLAAIRCELKYLRFDENTLLFCFKYGAVYYVINLLSREIGWIKNYLKKDKTAIVFPEHFRNKVGKKQLS